MLVTENEKVIYQVKGASGFSKKNLITRAGGANGVMTVKVTNHQLILTFGAFFKPFAKLYDILKTIPINRIKKMEITKGIFKKRLEINYQKDDGKTCTVVIHNTDVEQLKKMIESQQEKL